MSLNYFIENTDQTLDFSLSPGEKDGFGGTSRNTDLTLHGYGVLAWGEAVNENQLRLLENHACPEKELNDYNPVSEAYDYDPATDPLLPKDENDFGSPSKGINLPTTGQLWYNKTQDRTFVFTTVGEWVLTASGIPTIEPTSPTTGDLWYDTGVPQLKIWDGASWDSVAERYVLKSGDTMTGTLTLAGPPSSDLHAATKKYVDDQIGGSGYVSKGGDTMTGILTLSGPPVAGNDAATLDYVNQQVFAAGYVLKAGDTMTGNLSIVPVGDAELTVTSIGGAPTITMIPFYSYEDSTFQMTNYNNAKQVSRMATRAGAIFTWESDNDHHPTGATGPNTNVAMSLDQGGLLVVNGNGAASGVYATHCTIPIINFFGSKMLTTKEYVDAAVAGAGGGDTLTYITPVVIAASGAYTGWLTYANPDVIPIGATKVILDTWSTTAGPDYFSITTTEIRRAEGYHSYILGANSAWGDGDGSGNGGMGIFPCDPANGRFQYIIGGPNGTPTGYTDARVRIIGYVT